MNSIITDNLDSIAALCEKFEVRQLEVFGSAARDDFDEETSDVDLLLRFAEHIGPRELLNRFHLIEAELGTLFGRSVDVHLLSSSIERKSGIWDRIRADRKVVFDAEHVPTTS